MAILNDDLSIKHVVSVDTSKLDSDPQWEFVGLEDARLFRWDNKLYLCGVRRDTTTNGEGRMELSEIRAKTTFVDEMSRTRIPAPGNKDSYCEKNWMPIIDKPYHFVKWSNPTEVVHYDIHSKITKTVHLDESKFIQFPESDFILYQPFLPAGDQPTAIAGLIEGINDGLSYQTLLGVTGSGKTYTMANVIAQMGRPAVVFAPNKTLAAQLYSEFREFFPRNAVEYFVSYYDYYQPEAYVPTRDLFIEKDSSINEHIEQMRLSATKSLLERRDVIIVASVSAIYGIGNPGDYHRMVLTLRQGDKINQHELIQRLVAMQYERNEVDFSRGTFRVRGDTIDIFPAEHNELAIRVELFDDQIDRLQFFDPLTGRIKQKIARFTVYPGSHYVTPRDTVLKAVELIKVELRERVAELLKDNKLVEAQRLEQRTRFDLEMLAELGFCKGIENYSRHLSGALPGEAPPTLIDYLPQDALMFLDESHVLIGQFNGMYNGDRARKVTLVDFGFRLPSALDNRPLKFVEFESKMRQTVFVSATPADYENQKPRPRTPQLEGEVNHGQARTATRADHNQDCEGQPRQKGTESKRAKAAKR